MILWLNPVSGVSGDMLLGALLDLGAPLDAVCAAIAGTGLTGWSLSASTVTRGGLRAVHADVTDDRPGTSRAGAELAEIAARAEPAPAGQVAAAAIQALIEAEAHIHQTSTNEVHLHELAGTDTLVDTIGVAAAVHWLNIEQVWSAPVGLGTGTVPSAHGLLPVPAPATLALLAGADVTDLGPAGETVTPTGAALLTALGCQYGPAPAMRLVRSGYGAGTRNPPSRPNVLPAMLGDHAHPPGTLPASQQQTGECETSRLCLVETTVDDVTGELLAGLPGALIGAGALDAWITAVLGKKGRPAHLVTALCAPQLTWAVEDVLLRETGSLGARRHTVLRDALPRASGAVEVRGHRIRVKTGPHGSKPEHDDVLAVAAQTGLTARTIAELARAATDRPPR